MAETGIGLASGYGQVALARIAYSAAAAELSDASRSRVHTDSDQGRPIGEFVDDALQLVARAAEVLDRAVVLERERGASWAQIGEKLEISKQAAHQKYGSIFEQWRAALDEPLVQRGKIFDCRLPDGPDDPEAWVRRLDSWVNRHKDPDDAKRSVSGQLERATLTEQVVQLLRLATVVRDTKDATKRRAFLERKAELLKRIAESRPGDSDAVEAAEAANQLFAGLDEDAIGASRRR